MASFVSTHCLLMLLYSVISVRYCLGNQGWQSSWWEKRLLYLSVNCIHTETEQWLHHESILCSVVCIQRHYPRKDSDHYLIFLIVCIYPFHFFPYLIINIFKRKEITTGKMIKPSEAAKKSHQCLYLRIMLSSHQHMQVSAKYNF